MELQSTLSELFCSIDSQDTEKFLGFLTDEAQFRFGSSPPVSGSKSIAELVDGFFDSINSSEHQLIRTWQDESSCVCQGEVTYERLDGTRLTLPFVNIFGMQSGKIDEYLIYVDIAPLFEPWASG